MPPSATLAVTVHRRPASRGVGIVLPGFLDDSGSGSVAALAGAVLAAGLTAVTFDPRGTGRSPGTPADCAPTVQLADLRALLDRFAGDGRTVLVGHCYGALLAGLAAADDPRVTDVVALMPTRCFIWPDDYDPRRDTWALRGELHLSRRWCADIAVPHEVVADALDHDLPAALGRLRPRILFVAGERDRLIPTGAVERLYDECGSPAKTLRLLPVQHDFRDDPAQVALVHDTVRDWLVSARASAPDILHARDVERR